MSPSEHQDNNQCSSWWRSFFDSPDCLVLGQFPDATTSRWEAGKIADLVGLQPGMVVADAPCGSGRHLPTWVARGCFVVGLDASPMMLELARRVVAGLKGRALLVQGLMQALPFAGETFDVMLNLFNSFGYLATDEENARVLTEAARCLRRGGRLLIDTRNPPMEILFAPYRDEVKLPGGRRLQASASYSRETKRLSVCWRDLKEDRLVHWVSIRLYNVGELSAMLEAARLEVEAVFGSLEGEKFSSAHSKMIVLARRP